MYDEEVSSNGSVEIMMRCSAPLSVFVVSRRLIAISKTSGLSNSLREDEFEQYTPVGKELYEEVV
jgi:hypothetical protein